MKRTAAAAVGVALGASTLVAVGSLTSACREHIPHPDRTTHEPTPTPIGLDARPANATCFAPAAPASRVRLEPALGGAAFDKPVDMVDKDDQGLVYIAEMPGRVKVFDRATGGVSTVLDLVGKVGSYFEQGLLGMAVHPRDRFLYLTVERDTDATSRSDLPFRSEILRFDLSADGKTADPTTEKVLLRLDRPTTLHYAGTLKFGPDGMLYIGVGDGGRYYADVNVRPDSSTLLGTILRVDVDGAWPYAIPPDNPYAAGGGRGEIYARGFRNPWRFSFDRATGELWAGDVGDVSYEEINKVERGKDYGWPIVEGERCFRPQVGCDPSGLEPPVFSYPRAEGASITGGYVYRGSLLTDFQGVYLFADFAAGRVFALQSPPTADHATALPLNAGGPKPTISSFAEDAAGELFALDWTSGLVLQLLPSTEPDGGPVMPALLSQTGCVDPSDPAVPAAGLLPYDVTMALWSDGADKDRFVAIPDDATIAVGDDQRFTLPERGVLMKTFSKGGLKIETRLLVRHPGGEWSGVSYAWNEAQTDATRLDTSADQVLADGTTWTIPSPAQCFVCHTKAAGVTLGLQARQLDRDETYAGGRVGNQLATLSHIGYLDTAVASPLAGKFPSLDDPSAPVAERARAYLDVNCSMCHRADGATGARIDLRATEPLSAVQGCSVASLPEMPGGTVLAPGDPEASVLYRRMTRRDTLQMPPLATRQIDDDAAAVVGEWIRSLTACE